MAVPQRLPRSSPQLRRALPHLTQPLQLNRIIPAGVGSTWHRCRSGPGTAVHPPRVRGTRPSSSAGRRRAGDHRGCGEHRPMPWYSSVNHGSSPQVPGSTCRRRPASPARPDHPRGCEEHATHVDHTSLAFGSSPRAWGARPDLAPDPAALRTRPRGCGEDVKAIPPTTSANGSSPQALGAPLRDHIQPGEHRIIPAGTGNTSST